jgi:hypothetical protein
MGPRSDPGSVEKREISCLFREANPDSSVVIGSLSRIFVTYFPKAGLCDLPVCVSMYVSPVSTSECIDQSL